jgi:ribosome-associated translation inhibitor RaiA
MKGFVQMLAGLVFMFVVFYVVNWYLSANMKREIAVADIAADSYKIINAIEFAKMNAKQNLKFSVQKTLKDMKIDASNVKTDSSLREKFIENLKKNYSPTFNFGEADVSVSVKSIEIKDSKVVATLDMKGSGISKRATAQVNILYSLD